MCKLREFFIQLETLWTRELLANPNSSHSAVRVYISWFLFCFCPELTFRDWTKCCSAFCRKCQPVLAVLSLVGTHTHTHTPRILTSPVSFICLLHFHTFPTFLPLHREKVVAWFQLFNYNNKNYPGSHIYYNYRQEIKKLIKNINCLFTLV